MSMRQGIKADRFRRSVTVVLLGFACGVVSAASFSMAHLPA